MQPFLSVTPLTAEVENPSFQSKLAALTFQFVGTMPAASDLKAQNTRLEIKIALPPFNEVTAQGVAGTGMFP